MKKIFIYLLLFPILYSCQSIEISEDIVFDYEQFTKLTFMSNDIEVKNLYNSNYNDPFIDHVMEKNPSVRINEWINSNVKGFGVEKKLIITINDASIIVEKVESQKKIAGISKKIKETQYNLNFEIVYSLYDDTDVPIANTEVKVTRSTTSADLISLYERDKILDELVYKSLMDLGKKSDELLKIYMKGYIL